MRHKKARHRLNRFTSWRKATLTSLARSIIKYQSVKTTKAKAHAAQPLVEKLISLTKSDTLFSRRRAYEILCDHQLVSLLFKDIGPRFKHKNSGYTRIMNLGPRRGDNALMTIFELTEIQKKTKKVPAKKKKPEVEGEITPEAEIKKEKPVAEQKKAKTGTGVQEKPTTAQKPSKKFLGGLRGIFKKERDSL